jgi:hypothetical protein
MKRWLLHFVLLFVPSAMFAAVSLIQTSCPGNADCVTPTSTCPVPFVTATVNAGDLVVIVEVAQQTSLSFPSTYNIPSDAYGNTYALAGGTANQENLDLGGDGPYSSAEAYSVITTGHAANFTITMTATANFNEDWNVCMYDFRGLASGLTTANVLDGYNSHCVTNPCSGTQGVDAGYASSSPITTTLSGDIMVAQRAWGTCTANAGTGWTVEDTLGADSEYIIQGAAGTYYALYADCGTSPYYDTYSVEDVAFKTVLAAEFSYSPSPVAFGSINTGSNSHITVTITNNGGASLNLGTLSSSSGLYVISSDGCSGNDIAASGGTCTFILTFSPLVAGSQNSTVSVPDNVGNPDTISDTGTGVVIASAIVFGTAGISLSDLGIR